MLTPHEKIMATLAGMGGLIGLAKVLESAEPLTLRLIVGRVILGSAVSMCAGAALIRFPDLPPVAVNGLGAALGIVGYQAIELWLHRRALHQNQKEGKHNDIE